MDFLAVFIGYDGASCGTGICSEDNAILEC